MDTINIPLGEEFLITIIKDLMSLPDESSWTYTTMKSKLTLRFRGNIHNVQREIFNWLNLPARKAMFKGE